MMENKMPMSQTPQESIASWRQQLIRSVLRVLSIAGGLAVASAVYDAVISDLLWQIPIIVGAYLLLLVITFWRRVPYALQPAVLLFLIYALGVFNLIIAGQTGDGFPFMMTLPLLAAIFYGRRAGVISTVIATLTLILFSVLFVSGPLFIQPQDLPSVTDVGSWLSRIVVFVMLVLLLVLPENYLFQRLATALTQSAELSSVLTDQRADLAALVEERTANLARRARYLEATADVARDAASVLDVQTLLGRVAILVSERFGFYHTGIFLIDPTGEWAVLQAASSEGGRRMLDRGHRLRVGQTGTVGYVTSRGEPRIALDVGEDAVFFDNPDLPETRSAMTLPLRARGQIIGALDVQSEASGAFTQEDAAALQTLADQVALAINNARLFEQAQARLQVARRASGELSREAWATLLETEAAPGYVSSRQGTYPVSGLPAIDITDAADVADTAIDIEDATEVIRNTQYEIRNTLALIPIKLRDQVLGVVRLRKPEERGAWTPRELALMTSVSEQLGVALESARLFEDSRRLATQERLVGEVSARMRESLEVDAVLRTAVSQLRAALQLAEVEVRMGDYE